MQKSQIFIIFLFLFFSSVHAMERDIESQLPERVIDSYARGVALDSHIRSAIEQGNISYLVSLLQQRRECVMIQLHKGDRRSHHVKQQHINEAFEGARQAAEKNVEEAQKNLELWTNLGRLGQLFGGIATIGFGFGKAVYDIVQFWDEDIETRDNVLNLFSDGSLIVAGAYGLKLAYDNTVAKHEYNQALAIQYLVTQASQIREKRPKA